MISYLPVSEVCILELVHGHAVRVISTQHDIALIRNKLLIDMQLSCVSLLHQKKGPLSLENGVKIEQRCVSKCTPQTEINGTPPC